MQLLYGIAPNNNESKVAWLTFNQQHPLTTTKHSASNGKHQQLNYAEMSSACVGNGDC